MRSLTFDPNNPAEGEVWLRRDLEPPELRGFVAGAYWAEALEARLPPPPPDPLTTWNDAPVVAIARGDVLQGDLQQATRDSLLRSGCAAQYYRYESFGGPVSIQVSYPNCDSYLYIFEPGATQGGPYHARDDDSAGDADPLWSGDLGAGTWYLEVTLYDSDELLGPYSITVT